MDPLSTPPPALRPSTQMTDEDHSAIAHLMIDRYPISYYEALNTLGFISIHKMKAPSEAKDDQDHWYFVTLTQPDTDKTFTRLDKTVSRILKSKQVNATEWCYVRELTASGTPHIHMRLRVPAYLDFRVIKKFNDNYRIDVQLERQGCYNYLLEDKKVHPTGEWFYASKNYTGPLPTRTVEGGDLNLNP